MSDEKITSELVNEMACNAICFQKNPSETWVDVKKLDPTTSKVHLEKGWEYKSPALIVLYESGRIVYANQIYHMNEKTRNTLLQTLKNQEKAAKRKELGQMIRYTIAASASILAVLAIIHSVQNTVNSEQNNKEQQTSKVRSVKDAVPNANYTDFVLQKNIQKQK